MYNVLERPQSGSSNNVHFSDNKGVYLSRTIQASFLCHMVVFLRFGA